MEWSHEIMRRAYVAEGADMDKVSFSHLCPSFRPSPNPSSLVPCSHPLLRLQLDTDPPPLLSFCSISLLSLFDLPRVGKGSVGGWSRGGLEGTRTRWGRGGAVVVVEAKTKECGGVGFGLFAEGHGLGTKPWNGERGIAHAATEHVKEHCHYHAHYCGVFHHLCL